MAQMTLLVLDAEGWGDVYNDNMQKINNQIDSLLDPTKTVHATGTTIIPNLGDVVSAPAAISANLPNLKIINGTGDDGDLNDNFTDIENFADAVDTDLNNLRNSIISNQTILTNLVNKVNSILDEIREGSGIAILKA